MKRDYKVGYFDEKPGLRSSTRLNSFVLLMFLMVFDMTMALFVPGFVLNYYFIILNIVFLLGVFAPKYFHKILETRLFQDGDKPDTPQQ